jgi:hypothetical protein
MIVEYLIRSEQSEVAFCRELIINDLISDPTESVLAFSSVHMFSWRPHCRRCLQIPCVRQDRIRAFSCLLVFSFALWKERKENGINTEKKHKNKSLTLKSIFNLRNFRKLFGVIDAQAFQPLSMPELLMKG